MGIAVSVKAGEKKNAIVVNCQGQREAAALPLLC